MPTFNVWISAESFADLDTDFVIRTDIAIEWNKDFTMFRITKAS